MKEIIFTLYSNHFWFFIVSIMLSYFLRFFLKNNWYKSYWKIWFLLFIISITLWLSNWVLKHYSSDKSIQLTWYVETTTGAINVIEQFFWDEKKSIINNIGVAIRLWVRGKDFISIVPNSQPNIFWETSDENNEVMRQYLSKYRSEFTMPAWKTEWYIIFITTKQIAGDRDMYLWLRWKTEWYIHKNKSLEQDQKNWYIYNIGEIPVSDWTSWKNLFKLSSNWKLQIGAFVAETDNKIEKIIMVFKN